MKNQTLSDEKIDKLIQTNYSGSFMNNSKWVKLIQLLVDNYDLIKVCNVKLIFDDKIRNMKITGDEQYDFDFYSNSMESMVSDPIIPGWTSYKEIEWIGFPTVSDSDNIKQDILKIKQCVNGLGKFNEELTNEYYRIYAYR
jgi:hypothetical protein